MFQLQVLYAHPEDPAAFDKHYRETHAKLAAAIPGVTRYTCVWCAPGPDGVAPEYYAVATIEAESAEALGSPEGQAATDDLANFAQAGVTMLAGDAEQYV